MSTLAQGNDIFAALTRLEWGFQKSRWTSYDALTTCPQRCRHLFLNVV
jgi:hypothetical protein